MGGWQILLKSKQPVTLLHTEDNLKQNIKRSMQTPHHDVITRITVPWLPGVFLDLHSSQLSYSRVVCSLWAAVAQVTKQVMVYTVPRYFVYTLPENGHAKNISNESLFSPPPLVLSISYEEKVNPGNHFLTIQCLKRPQANLKADNTCPLERWPC